MRSKAAFTNTGAGRQHRRFEKPQLLFGSLTLGDVADDALTTHVPLESNQPGADLHGENRRVLTMMTCLEDQPALFHEPCPLPFELRTGFGSEQLAHR